MSCIFAEMATAHALFTGDSEPFTNWCQCSSKGMQMKGCCLSSFWNIHGPHSNYHARPQEIDTIFKIFRVLGTPDEEVGITMVLIQGTVHRRNHFIDGSYEKPTVSAYHKSPKFENPFQV